MASRERQDRSGATFAEFLRRRCLWLLVACYALAAIWPSPGRFVRAWHWESGFASHASVTVPLLLLALLLFCAALVTDVAQIRSVAQRPWALVAGLLAVWLGPTLLVLVAALLVPRVIDGPATVGLMVGLALVASMPVANSSVGWTQMLRGNLALGLALILVSIFLSPWVTPRLLGWLQQSLAHPEQVALARLIESFSGTFFIVWVILPTAAGLACHWMVGTRRVTALADWIAVVSVAALLLLNYVNAALALPEVLQQSRPAVLFATLVLAAALSLVGLATAWLVARLLRLSDEERAALLFGLSMKHTGLALLLAGAVLADQGLAILVIVLATLAQHLTAGIVEWRLQADA